MSEKPLRPEFSSDIPDFLLRDVSDKEKWLYENISMLSKQSNFVLDEQLKQNEKLASIEIQTKITNGTVKDHKAKLAMLDGIVDDLKDIVGTKRLIAKIGGSKWTWIMIGFTVTGAFQVLTNPHLRTWLLALIS